MISVAVETILMVSPLTVLAPVVALGAGALLAFALSRQTGVPDYYCRAIALASVLLALLLMARHSETYALMVLLPFGNISIPLVDIRLDAAAVSSMRYVLLAGLALILVMPADAASAGLALLGAASASLMAGTLGALAIAWMVTEAAYLLFGGPRARVQMSALPLSLGGICMVLAIYGSASQEAMVLSDASLQRSSWVLLLVAACLRLRLWPLSWPDAEPAVMALWMLTGFSTVAALFARLAPSAASATVPLWLLTFIVLSGAVSAVKGWTHRQGTGRQDAGVAIAALLLPLAATTLPASGRLAPALAHLGAVVVVLAIAPSLPRPAATLGAARSALPLLAVATLLPLPFLPFGGGYLEALTRIGAQRPLGTGLGVVVVSLAGALLVCRALELDDRPILSLGMGRFSLVALAGSLLALSLGLGLGGSWNADQRGTLAISAGAGLLAWLGVAATAGLVLGRQRGVLAFAPPSPLVVAWPERAAVEALRAVDTVLRLIEGETALTWTTVIGVAILSVALQA